MRGGSAVGGRGRRDGARRDAAGLAASLALALAACAVGGSPTASTIGPGPTLDSGTASDAGSDDDSDDGDDDGSQDGGSGGGADTTGQPPTSGTDGSDSSDSGDCTELFWYADADGDGAGDPNAPMLACDAPPGHVDNLDDCDDDDANNAPSLDETCDGQDNDCDALIDELSAANATCNGCTLAMDAEHAYAFCPDPATFDDGRTMCQAFGGDLIKIEAAAEIAFITSADVPPSNGVGGYLIGLNDRQTEGQYVWTDDTAAVYTNYNAGEPNDAAGAEDCTEISTTVGIWNDVPCDDGRAFICEAQ